MRWSARRIWKSLTSRAMLACAVAVAAALPAWAGRDSATLNGHGLGCRLEGRRQGMASAQPFTPPAALNTLPSSWDNSAGMPPVGDQGQQNSCVGWSIGYALKGYMEGQQHGWDMSDLNNWCSPAFVYNQINGGDDNGSFPDDAHWLIAKRGICLWPAMPYDETDAATWPSAAAAEAAVQNRSLSYGYLAPAGVSAIKQALQNGQCLVVAFQLDYYFEFLFMDNGPGGLGTVNNFVWYPDASSGIAGGHAMCIVGYDDNRADSNGHVGAFKCQNSWGLTGGENNDGFMWIAYAAMSSTAIQSVSEEIDRIGYTVQAKVRFSVSHPARGYLNIQAAAGPMAHSNWKDTFYSNTMQINQPATQFFDMGSGITSVLDVTDGAAWLDGNSIWWVTFSDSAADGNVGEVMSCQLEYNNHIYPGKTLPALGSLPVAMSDKGSTTIVFTGIGPTANLTMVASPLNGGATFPTNGQVYVTPLGLSTPVTITATPALSTGWVFDHWGAVGGAAIADTAALQTTVTLSGDATVTAWFVQPPPGTVWGWGMNSNGQLGDRTVTQRLKPVLAYAVPPNTTQVAGGLYHSLVLASNGTVYSWGSNSNGQLGIGTLADSHQAIKVSTLSKIIWIAAGTKQSFAVDSSGAVWAWGCNSAGQLGDGSRTDRKTPVRLTGFGTTKIVQVAAGDTHALALDSNGNVWSWGTNPRGQLGKSTNVYSLTPMKIPGLSGVAAIASGANHALALTGAGRIWGWGGNESGQVGVGTHTDVRTPTMLTSLSGVAKLGTGGFHSLAIKSDGSVWSWGSNVYGQMGQGTDKNTFAVPMAVLKGASQPLGNGAEAIGGNCHTLVLDKSGYVWTMGSNAQGQLGDGTTTTHKYAASITGLIGMAHVGAGGWDSLGIGVSGTDAPGPAGAVLIASGTAGSSGAASSGAPAAVQGAPVAPPTQGFASAAPVADIGGTTVAGVPAGPVALADVIVDNLDHSATKQFKPVSGNWVTVAVASAVNNGACAGSYAQAASGASATAAAARARFSCTGLAAGTYDVYAWWPAKADNSAAVVYEVRHASGVTTVRVNQTERGGQWNLLGTFDFAAGSAAVDVQSGGSKPGTLVCADAVRFAPAGTDIRK